MVSFDGGSAGKVDDVTALPSRHKMAAMRIMSLILHLQQYSHRLNLFFFFFIIENAWSKKQKRVFLFSNYQ